MKNRKQKNRLPYFIILSIFIHGLILFIKFDGNSDISNEFVSNGVSGLPIQISLEPNHKKNVTQDEMNEPIRDFIGEVDFDMLVDELDEDCSTAPFQNDDNDNI